MHKAYLQFTLFEVKLVGTGAVSEIWAGLLVGVSLSLEEEEEGGRSPGMLSFLYYKTWVKVHTQKLLSQGRKLRSYD